MAKEKAKAPTYVVLTDDDPERPVIEAFMRSAIREDHDHLVQAKIAIAWRVGFKPDADGKLVLGKMKVVGELEREMHDFDAALILNRETWAKFDDKQRAALVDHELCHLELARDEEGETLYDGHGRIKYRARKHDVEEFEAIILRHGCYKADLESFARAALASDPNLSLFDGSSEGGATTVSVNGGKAHPVGSPQANAAIAKTVKRAMRGGAAAH